MTKKYLKIPLMEPNVPNRNGVIYSPEAIESAYKKLREQCESQGVSLGEFEIDSRATNDNYCFVHLTHVSHTIKDVELQEDGTLVGTVTLLDTLPGNAIQSWVSKPNPFLDDPELILAPRGYGKSENNIVKEFTLISIDICMSPHHAWDRAWKQFKAIFGNNDNNEKNI